MFKFTVGSILLLTSENTDLNLRTPVGSNGAVDGTGGTGVAAKWVVYSSVEYKTTAAPLATTDEKKVHDESAAASSATSTSTTTYRLVQLQRYQDPTYFLRIYNDWVDANGLANDAANYLQVSDSSSNVVIMQSNQYSNQRIGILPNGQVKTPSTVNFGIAAQFLVTDVTFNGSDRKRETVRLMSSGGVPEESLGLNLRWDTDGTVAGGKRAAASSLVLKVVDTVVHREITGQYKLDDKKQPIATKTFVQLQSAADPQRHIRLHQDGKVDGRGLQDDELTVLQMIKPKNGVDGVYYFESKKHPGKFLDITRAWGGDSERPPLVRITLTAL